MSEINITPLLDLAFVLLIIFVITTPLLEQSLNLKLPEGRQAGPAHRAETTFAPSRSAPGGLDARTPAPVASTRSRRRWSAISSANPNLVVYIRADENCRWKDVEAVIDRCQRNGITRTLGPHRTAQTLMDRLQKKCFVGLGGYCTCCCW